VSDDREPVWANQVQWLSEITHGEANARLLALAQPTWEGRVIPRTSMTDLLFTIPGDVYPFTETVRVSWSDGAFEFRLTAERGKLVTADRCFEPSASAALDSFLSQLVGEP
jgi:hypothetical protein